MERMEDSRWRRVLRGAGVIRSPLRRGIDRFEGYVTVLLLAVFLVAAPFAAWHTGTATYRHGVASEHVERATRSRTEAVVLPGTRPSVTSQDAGVLGRTPARWTAPDGTPRTGYLPVTAGSRTHNRVTIWVDHTGRPVGPPRQHSQTIGDSVTFGMLTILALAGLLWLIRSLLHRLLDRRRMEDWQAAWLVTEPLWSGRHRGRQ